MPAKTARRQATASDHPLAHLIPKGIYAPRDEAADTGSYECRYFNGHRDVDVLDWARKVHWNTLLYGPTGPGKTSCVYAYAAERGIPVVYVGCNGAVDPATLFVNPVLKTADVNEVFSMAIDLAAKLGKTWEHLSTDEQLRFLEVAGSIGGERAEMVVTEVVIVIQCGGILYLDEVNAMPPRIAMALHGLMDFRRGVTIPQLGNKLITAHPDLQIIATYNPDYHGTKPLNQAFKNRFGLQLPFDYDRKIEEKFIVGIPSLLDLADMLRKANQNGELETPVGPNMLMEFEQLAEGFGVEFAVTNFVNRFEAQERASVRKTITDFFDTRIREEYKEWADDDEPVVPAKKGKK